MTAIAQFRSGLLFNVLWRSMLDVADPIRSGLDVRCFSFRSERLVRRLISPPYPGPIGSYRDPQNVKANSDLFRVNPTYSDHKNVKTRFDPFSL